VADEDDEPDEDPVVPDELDPDDEVEVPDDDPDDDPEVPDDPDEDELDEAELDPPDPEEGEEALPVPELEQADTARAITLSAMAPVMVLRNISDLRDGRSARWCRGVSRRLGRGIDRPGARWPAVVLSAGARQRRRSFVSAPIADRDRCHRRAALAAWAGAVLRRFRSAAHLVLPRSGAPPGGARSARQLDGGCSVIRVHPRHR
jgi:hypothetical protein